MTITVLGAGSWGTALALLLARNGHTVTLAGRDADEMEAMNLRRENLRYLPGFALPNDIAIEVLDADLAPTDLWVVAVPSSAIREVVDCIPEESPHLVLCSKGLEPVSGLIPSAVAQEVRPSGTVAALSGPNLAMELVRGVPTLAVAACAEAAVAERIRGVFLAPNYRVYVGDDVVGVELAGALKNVLAIAAGLSDGLGYGDNTKGALLARGLHEMTRLGMAMGAEAHTFFGIAGVGDLIATANSRLSRNYRVGEALGKSKLLKDILAEIGQVAEGVSTSESAVMLARRYGVEAPIFEATHGVIRGHLRPMDAVSRLMERIPRREGFFDENEAGSPA